MTRIFVSTTHATFRKGIAGVETPSDENSQAYKEWKALLGRKVTFGFKIQDMSMRELADHVSSGYGISVGLFKEGHRSGKNRTGGYLVGLDFEVSDVRIAEGVNPADGWSVEKVTSHELLKKYIGVALPSASDKPDAPRCRALIPLSRSISPSEYNSIYLIIKKWVGDYLANGESRDSVRMYFGSTPDPARVYVNEEAVMDVDAFLLEYAPTDETEDEYKKSPLAAVRMERHFAQPKTAREGIVLECLDFILRGHKEVWGRDDWRTVAFAAHIGSDGSDTVRDFIASHPLAPWHLKGASADNFISEWNVFQPREDGVTLSSLFWWARKYGWLSQTGHEIPDNVCKHINVRYVQEWIEEESEIPTRCLLMSQTGSGKTFSLKYLYERLGKPKTVVFVPSTKLAMEMAGTLYNEYGLPTTLYINPANGVIKDTKELAAADILITTLQTFATKVFGRGIPMSNYGLVYIEESDQLLQQFARGGDTAKSIKSHVSQIEAQRGYACVREVFNSSGVVWCVDATMSRVTYEVAESLRGKTPMVVIKNDWTQPKAAVQMLDTRGDAYQVISDALYADKKVVVCCDTQQAAEELTRTMKVMGRLDNKKHLCITKHSERDKEVIEFMSNVNQHAPEYDLVIYNSVMASGVSITSVTPDVLVQIATYLTPRSNIQMLNRYRNQDKVYCYYRDTENLYVKNALELQTEAERKAWVEAGVVNIAIAQRSDDAVLRNRIVAISVADEYEQERSAKDFYIALLKRDGREVTNPFQASVSTNVKAAIAIARSMNKLDKEFVREHWNEVDPIEVDDVPDESVDKMTLAQGRTHRHIRDIFNGEVPEGEPSEIYDIAKAFSSKLGVISSFLQQAQALEKSSKALMSYEVSVMMLANQITLMKVISSIHMLYHTLDEEIDDDILASRASLFMAFLSGMAMDYDAVINRDRQKYQEVYDRSSNDADRALDFCKILLSYVGLKQRSMQVRRNGERISINKIVNLQEFHKFLEWRKLGDIGVLTIEALNDTIESRADAIEKFNKMDDITKSLVIMLVNQHNNIDFQSAVEIALDRGNKF